MIDQLVQDHVAEDDEDEDIVQDAHLSRIVLRAGVRAWVRVAGSVESPPASP